MAVNTLERGDDLDEFHPFPLPLSVQLVAQENQIPSQLCVMHVLPPLRIKKSEIYFRSFHSPGNRLGSVLEGDKRAVFGPVPVENPGHKRHELLERDAGHPRTDTRLDVPVVIPKGANFLDVKAPPLLAQLRDPVRGWIPYLK